MPLPELLERLLTTPGPSGQERAAAAVWREAAAPVGEVSSDTLGNSWTAPSFPATPSTESPRAPRPSRDRIDDVIDARQTAEAVLYEIRRVIVGQDAMLERVLVALLAGGHLLLEASRASPRPSRSRPSPTSSMPRSAGSSSPRTSSPAT